MIADLAAGVAAFGILLAYDWKKAKGGRLAFAYFAAGALLLAIATGRIAVRTVRLPFSALQWFGAATVAVWLALYGYVLFAALPSGEVYGAGRRVAVCTTGIYGRCRHPGAWCFCGTYLGLALAAASVRMAGAAALFTACHFGYVYVQDRWLFPRYIEGYGEYRKTVPFLNPFSGRFKTK